MLTIRSWWWWKKVEWFPEVRSEVPPKLLVVIFKVHFDNPRTSATLTKLANLVFLPARRGALASVSNYVNSRGASAAYLRGWIGPVVSTAPEHVHKFRSRNANRVSISFSIQLQVFVKYSCRCNSKYSYYFRCYFMRSGERT